MGLDPAESGTPLGVLFSKFPVELLASERIHEVSLRGFFEGIGGVTYLFFGLQLPQCT